MSEYSMKPKRLEINEAVKCLRDGGVIAYPTEAVWGLGWTLDLHLSRA